MPAEPASVRRADRTGFAVWCLLSAVVVAVWLCLFELARLLEYQAHASLWFPPVAISVATLATLGWRGVPAIAASTVLATYLGASAGAEPTAGPAVAQYALIFTVKHLAVWGGLAWLLRLACRDRTSVAGMPLVVTCFLLGGAVASLVSACLGSAGLVATGAIDIPTMVEQSIPWAIGDYAGLLALAPLATGGLLRLSEALRIAPAQEVERASELLVAPAGTTSGYVAKLALLLGTTLAVMLLAAALPHQEAAVFALFVVIVVQLWIVHTHGTLHALVAIAAFSLLIVFATPALDLGSRALALQFVMISLAANSYFGLAVPGLYADNSRLRHALVRDPVTGALSRSGFMEKARRELQAATREDAPAALVIADMDDLKAINDEFGHAAGDEALRALVRRARSRLQPGCLLGRLGGDEFAFYLPRANLGSARRLVGELREALARPLEGDESTMPLSASFGIAVRETPGNSLRELLERADAQMYAEKRLRRAS